MLPWSPLAVLSDYPIKSLNFTLLLSKLVPQRVIHGKSWPREVTEVESLHSNTLCWGYSTMLVVAVKYGLGCLDSSLAGVITTM
jgi:hypothetical protein